MNLRNVFVVFFWPWTYTTTIDVEHLFKQLTNRNVAIKLLVIAVLEKQNMCTVKYSST